MIAIDLFSGCGGMSLGFINAGFNVVAAFDYWNPAIEVYRRNFSHPIFKYDLNHYEKNRAIFKKFNPQIIIGGPPCQDFSSAGKRDESLGRADLTIIFAKIVAVVSPKWFVMENVERIEQSRALLIAKQIFKDVNYGLTQKVLDASFCGVPQQRKRFFLIGELNGQDNIMLSYLENNLSYKPMTVREYLGTNIDIEFYYRHPRSYKRRGIFSINEPSPTIRGVNRPVPKGYLGHPGDPVAISSNIRSLTIKERSLIQTFPDNFKFIGTKSDIDQLIGNAVPVKLAEYVAKCINQYVGNTISIGKQCNYLLPFIN